VLDIDRVGTGSLGRTYREDTGRAGVVAAQEDRRRQAGERVVEPPLDTDRRRPRRLRDVRAAPQHADDECGQPVDGNGVLADLHGTAIARAAEGAYGRPSATGEEFLRQP
jgi:hypothetical protein